MRFTILKSNFNEVVSRAAHIIPRRPTQPILNGVFIKAGEDGIEVSATDYETSVTVKTPATVDEPGRALIPGRLITSIAARLPAKPVEVALQGDKLIVKAGSARFEIPTMNADEYPALAALPTHVGDIDGDLLASMVKGTGVAVANDDALPILTGVLVEGLEGQISMVATDRFRLAKRESEWNGNDFSALIPAVSLAEVAKGAAGAEVAVYGSESTLGMSTGGFSIVSRLIDGRFPDWRRLMPAKFTGRIDNIDRNEVTDVIKRIQVIAPDAHVRVEANNGGLCISAMGANGESATETISCDTLGENVDFAVNPGYLLSAVSTMPTPEISIGFQGELKPITVFAHDAQATGLENVPHEDLTIVMPVRAS